MDHKFYTCADKSYSVELDRLGEFIMSDHLAFHGNRAVMLSGLLMKSQSVYCRLKCTVTETWKSMNEKTNMFYSKTCASQSVHHFSLMFYLSKDVSVNQSFQLHRTLLDTHLSSDGMYCGMVIYACLSVCPSVCPYLNFLHFIRLPLNSCSVNMMLN